VTSSLVVLVPMPAEFAASFVAGKREESIG
jgi:hypothetical protein